MTQRRLTILPRPGYDWAPFGLSPLAEGLRVAPQLESGVRSLGVPSIPVALILLASVFVLPQPAGAQTLGDSEKMLVDVFRGARFRPSPRKPASDGTIVRAYFHRDSGTLFQLTGPPGEAHRAVLLVAANGKGLVFLAGFVIAICDDGSCNRDAVSDWLSTALDSKGEQERRFGKYVFSVIPPSRGLPLIAIRADARAAHEADLETARQAAEAEERRQAEEKRRRLATEAYEKRISALPTDATESDVRALLESLQAEDLDPTAKTAWIQQLSFRLGGLAASRSRRLLEAGEAEAAEKALKEAEENIETSGQPLPLLAEVRKQLDEHLAAREAAARLRQARAAEERSDYRDALLLYRGVLPTALSADARDGIDRIQNRRRSPALAAVLSAGIPGAGQFYTGRIPWGLAFLGGVASSAAVGTFLLVDAGNSYTQYLGATSPQQATDLYAGVQGRFYGGLALVGVAAVIYVWSLIDAAGGASKRNQELGFD